MVGGGVLKASDITDAQIFAVVDHVRATKRSWTSMTDLMEMLPEFPCEGPNGRWKIIHAKMRQMIAKKRIDGCPCGCRGDFQRMEFKG